MYRKSVKITENNVKRNISVEKKEKGKVNMLK